MTCSRSATKFRSGGRPQQPPVSALDLCGNRLGGLTAFLHTTKEN
jgi:hypothetical protein